MVQKHFHKKIRMNKTSKKNIVESITVSLFIHATYNRMVRFIHSSKEKALTDFYEEKFRKKIIQCFQFMSKLKT